MTSWTIKTLTIKTEKFSMIVFLESLMYSNKSIKIATNQILSHKNRLSYSKN